MKRIFYWIFCIALTASFLSCAGTDEKTISVPVPNAQEEPVSRAAPKGLREEFGFIDLADEQATEEEKLLMSLIWNQMAQQSWDHPENLDPDSFVNFYVQLSMEPYQETAILTEEWERVEDIGVLMPASVVEPAVQRHFDVSSAHLRTGMFYVAEKDAYWIGGLGSVANAIITDSQVDGFLHTISYEAYHDTELTGTGILLVEMKGGADYHYLSNSFMPVSLTPEQQALEDSFIKIDKDMSMEEKAVAALVCSDNGYSSWDHAEDVSQYKLLGIYDFLIQIGEAAIPDHVERDPYWKTPYLPANEVEAAVTSYYQVSTQYLREYHHYDPQRQAYRIPRGYNRNIRLVDAKKEESLLSVTYEVYNAYELGYIGILYATVSEDGQIQYRSCKIVEK